MVLKLMADHGDNLKESVMKKLLATILLLSSSPSFASGPYDGIYAVADAIGFTTNYVTVQEDASTQQMVMILLDPDPTVPWIALTGIRTDNNVTLASIIGISPNDISLNVTGVFNANNTLTATVTLCADGFVYACKFPTDSIAVLTRIF